MALISMNFIPLYGINKRGHCPQPYHSLSSNSSFWIVKLNDIEMYPPQLLTRHFMEMLLDLVEHLDELEYIIDSFKIIYVKQVFQTSDYESIVEHYGSMHFPWLLSEKHVANKFKLKHDSAWKIFKLDGGRNVILLSAFRTFQRIALALELVFLDLRYYRQFQSHYGRFWNLILSCTHNIIEKTYLNLIILKANHHELPKIMRQVIPLHARCPLSSHAKDVRDWIILRSVMVATDFYQRLLTKSLYDN